MGLCIALPPGLALALTKEPPIVQGVVTKVVDGDTLWLTPPGQPAIVVRLRDIDAPEACQPWGEQAKQALIGLALNKPATLHPARLDAHGRTIGMVWVDDLNLSVRMVEDGNAWSARTRWDQGPLVKQERMAQALRRGLHATDGAVSPSEFRRSHGPCAGAAAAPARQTTAAPESAPAPPAG